MTGIPERSQTRILSEGVVRRSKKEKYSGRPRKLDDGTIQKMIKSLEGHYKQRVESWDNLALQFGYDEEERPNAPLLLARTVKRYLNQAGYHKCRACQKSWINQNQADRRKAFCQCHQWPLWKWKMVYFLDECHFHMNSRHTDFVIRNNHKRYCSDYIQKRRRIAASQFSVWAMISINYKSPLIFYAYTEEVDKEFKNGNVRQSNEKIGGAMTQDRYIEQILPVVRRRKRLLDLQGKSIIFQEDNDGSYNTRSEENICKLIKDEMDLDYIDDWPANSPDLNPIENVWKILKSRVKKHHPTTDKALRKAIEKEWTLLSFKEINECILGSRRGPDRGKGGAKGKNCCIQNRINQCIERNGLSTEF